MLSLHVLAVTPGTGFHVQAWESVLAGGVDGFLIREPRLEARSLLQSVEWCQRHFPATPLWVGGRLDVALAAGCGLHAPEAYPEVPADLVPLSRPLHAEGQWPDRKSAEQLLVAPLFEVPGKGVHWGPQRLHAFLDTCPAGGPRILALGGVTPERIQALRHPRLAGIALIRALWEAPEPGALLLQLREAWAG